MQLLTWENAHAERFVRSVRQECLANLIPFGPAMLRRSLREYVEHDHLERNHQGMGNQLLTPYCMPRAQTTQVGCRSRLGGVLNFYERAAA